VYDILVSDGYRVRIVQEPLTGLDEVVAATRRVDREIQELADWMLDIP
jgi:hypothetical protein